MKTTETNTKGHTKDQRSYGRKFSRKSEVGNSVKL